MEATHLFALIPLLVLLILSLCFYGLGLLHIMTFSYGTALAIIGITNNWEIVFFPVVAFTCIITLILFIASMSRGKWI